MKKLNTYLITDSEYADIFNHNPKYPCVQTNIIQYFLYLILHVELYMSGNYIYSGIIVAQQNSIDFVKDHIFVFVCKLSIYVSAHVSATL